MWIVKSHSKKSHLSYILNSFKICFYIYVCLKVAIDTPVCFLYNYNSYKKKLLKKLSFTPTMSKFSEFFFFFCILLPEFSWGRRLNHIHLEDSTRIEMTFDLLNPYMPPVAFSQHAKSSKNQGSQDNKKHW